MVCAGLPSWLGRRRAQDQAQLMALLAATTAAQQSCFLGALAREGWSRTKPPTAADINAVSKECSITIPAGPSTPSAGKAPP